MSRPHRIILARHGESIGNKDKHYHAKVPDHKLWLTPRGHQQAIDCGEHIAALIGTETLHAYVSTHHRARETWAGIQTGLSPDQVKGEYLDSRIREQDWGHLRHPDKNAKVIEERDAFGHFHYRIPEGESGANVFDRVSNFLDTLHRDFTKPDYPDNTLIVTHGITLRIFIMRWFHLTPDWYENTRNPKNAECFVLTQNDADHRYELTTPVRMKHAA